MKKSLMASTMTLGICSLLSAQVGINIGENTTPKATLQIDGKPSETTAQDGVIIPRLTKAQLTLKDNVYLTDQEGALVFITDATGTNTGKTSGIGNKGFYYYDSTAEKWTPLTSPVQAVSAPNVKVINTGGDYTVTNSDDIIVVSTGTAGGTLDLYLPTSGIDIGKRITISIIGNRDNPPTVQLKLAGDAITPAIRDYMVGSVFMSGLTRTIVFLGQTEPNPNPTTTTGTNLSPWSVDGAY